MLTDNDIIPFGKYYKTLTAMANVPASYLIWLYEDGSETVRRLYPDVFAYIKDNLDVLYAEKKKWEDLKKTK